MSTCAWRIRIPRSRWCHVTFIFILSLCHSFLQAVKVGFHQPKTPFGIGQFINDAVAPSINELDFGQALASLHHYRSQSLSKANCELCGPNFWFQATKDIDEGQEVVTHYGHEFWLQKYLVEATQIQWRMLFYALQTQVRR